MVTVATMVQIVGSTPAAPDPTYVFCLPSPALHKSPRLVKGGLLA